MIEIRPYKPLDEDFIYHSWLASVDYNIPGVQRMTRLVIDTCVQDGTILVACSDEDPDHILGWLGYTEELEYPCLLYAFVKKKLRGHGIGGKLIRAKFPGGDSVPTAFWSYWCQKYNLKKKWGLKFNSLLLPVLVDRVHGKAKAKTEDKG
jgi:GNAT superfamily N-acetyltransferase